MKKLKKILISTFLSVVCLVFSSPVFAGNGLSIEQNTTSDIDRELSSVEVKMLSVCKNQILEELKCIILKLEKLKVCLKPQYRIETLTPFLDRISRMLGGLCGLSDEQKELVDKSYRRILYMKMPPAPNICAYGHEVNVDVVKMVKFDSFLIC